jgi:alpha-L-rhamnosidase
MINLRSTLVCLAAASAAVAAPVRLQCERLNNPLGIDSTVPRLSWQNDSTERNWRQSAYEILVSSAAGGKPDVWDSGKQSSADSVDIPYLGPKLESRKRYYWTVRVWDSHGKMSMAAAPAWWEMGLLNLSDWTAKWIAWKDQLEEDRAGISWISSGPTDRPGAGASPARLDISLSIQHNRAARCGDLCGSDVRLSDSRERPPGGSEARLEYV